MAKRLNPDERLALQNWEEIKKSILNATTIDTTETAEDKRRRITRLEHQPEEWFRYYFPNYYTSEPADFHKSATRRIIENSRWYEVRAWSRELAKTARTMMEVLYLALTGQVRNVLLISNSYDNAERLLTPYQLLLEYNLRITNDYGSQPKLGTWEVGEFTTTGGVSFRALGAGQSPRGTRYENFRPDVIIFDDIDTDEETRNPERIKKKWEWIEQAVIPTVSVSGSYRIIFCGNIIAKDCCITRAAEKADKVDTVNIRDDEGKSTWSAKNSEKDIDDILSKISTASAQKEYFNNPISEGDIFTEMHWGVCPPLKSLPFIIVYGDPSPSNRRGSKGASYKALFAIGYFGGNYYIYDGYLQQTTNADFIGWYYDLREKLGNKTVIYYYIENNTLQDPFWEQVLQPLNVKIGEKRGGVVPITADTRAKMDKFARIEASLEPLNRQNRLVLNEAERGNPHLQRLEEQFLMITPSLPAPADGPDCIEGGVFQTNQRLMTFNTEAIVIGTRRKSNKRF